MVSCSVATSSDLQGLFLDSTSSVPCIQSWFMFPFILACRLFVTLFIQRPVIIKNSGLVQPAVDSWDMTYMIENIGGNEHSITLSQSRQFLYYGSPEDNSDFEFIPPFTRTPGVFAEFIDLVEQLEQARNGSYTYFQVTSYVHTTHSSS